jgi:hypothetical protein
LYVLRLHVQNKIRTRQPFDFEDVLVGDEWKFTSDSTVVIQKYKYRLFSLTNDTLIIISVKDSKDSLVLVPSKQ